VFALFKGFWVSIIFFNKARTVQLAQEKREKVCQGSLKAYYAGESVTIKKFYSSDTRFHSYKNFISAQLMQRQNKTECLFFARVLV
jgi:hypothetical protein